MKRLIVLTSLCIALVLTLVATPVIAFDNVTPKQAYELAVNGSTDAVAYDGYSVYIILDVRTPEEWTWVGHPGANKVGYGSGLEGKVINVAYMVDKKGLLVVNKKFLKDIEEIFGDSANVVLITMCRSGGRSAAAAAVLEAAGFRAMNMLTGFQGGTDANGYRIKNGWVVDSLPYNYNGAGAYVKNKDNDN